jgi:hypothetical protein
MGRDGGVELYQSSFLNLAFCLIKKNPFLFEYKIMKLYLENNILRLHFSFRINIL